MSAPARLAVVVLAAVLSGAAPAAGQHLPQPRFAPAPRPPRLAFHQARFAALDTPDVSLKTRQTSTGWLVLGAVVGGALGGAIGAMVGSANPAGDFPDDPGAETVVSAFAGFVLLEPIGAGLGANLANHGRGSAGLDVLAAAAGTAVPIALAVLSRNPAAVLVAIPLPVVAAVVVERATARRAKP